jgi:hypothetical protein
MPRKKKTIKDFTYSNDNTTEINTSHRNIKKISSTIIIDFTELKTKAYRYLNIHTLSDDDMYQFLNLLNTIVPIDMNYIKIKKKNSITYDCDWNDMPSYNSNKNMENYGNILLTIEVIDNDNYIKFIHDYNDLFGCILWPQVTYMWYPERSKSLSLHKDKMYLSDVDHQPKYPIYIISKGRYEKRYTSKYLEWIGVDYKIVIEPQEYELYNKYIHSDKILTLPTSYLGLNQGSIPARNFVWWHSKESGVKRHWILDDNITSYKRYIDGQKMYVKNGLVFRALEDYVDRYDNVKMAGHNYTMFAVSLNTKLPPITLNTRIYSSILLSNDIFPHFTWRGKYNEDTDLSLRILKNGYPTILFNCILADKLTTLTQKGGNTNTIYNEKNALYKKARSLEKQHPDVTKIVQKFGRVHHQVDYSGFKQLTLQYNKDIIIENKVNEYGMTLVNKDVSELY